MPPRYVVPEEERVNAKVYKISNVELIADVLKQFDDKQKGEFKASCLGHLGELPKSKYSAQLLQLMVGRIIICRKMNEVWFMVNEKCLRFGLQEFALVTGLNCGACPTGPKVEKVVNTERIYDKYFKRMEKISLADLHSKFDGCKVKSDKYKLGLALIVEGVLASKDRGIGVSRETLSAVDDLSFFYTYPWGRISYDILIKSLKHPWAKKADMVKLNAKDQMSYMLYGFPTSLQVSVYEAISEIRSAFAKKIGDLLPRILRWEILRKTQLATYEDFIENNTVHVWATLRASEDEQQKAYWTSMMPPSDVVDEVFDKIVSDTTEIQEAKSQVPAQSSAENRDPKRRKKSGKATSGTTGQCDEEVGDNDIGRGKSTHACTFDVAIIKELLDSHTVKIEKKIDDVKDELTHRLDVIENKLKRHATPSKVDYHFDLSAMRERVNRFSSLGLELGENAATFGPSDYRTKHVFEPVEVSGGSSLRPSNTFPIDDHVGVSACDVVVQAENEIVDEEQDNEPLVVRRRSPSKRMKNRGPTIRTPYTRTTRRKK